MNLLSTHSTPEGRARSPQRAANNLGASTSLSAAPTGRRAGASAPYLVALARAAGKAVLGLLLIGLAAGNLHAQEPDNSAATNAPEAMALDQTNAATAMQVEDLVAALRTLQGEEPASDAGMTNGLPDNGVPDNSTNDLTSNPAGPAPSYSRPSGREMRSRWSSRQRTNQFGSDRSAGTAQSGTNANTGPALLSYESFRLIAQRNIFDPNRRPNRPYTPRDLTPSREPVYFTLVGTMAYQEGTFAFFSGSSSAYQKALKCSDTIGGYKVSTIGEDTVKLSQDTNQVELHIGMQMRLNEDGSWTPSNPPTTYTVNDFQPASNSTSSASGSAASGPESEILKRLMEKREKE